MSDVAIVVPVMALHEIINRLCWFSGGLKDCGLDVVWRLVQ